MLDINGKLNNWSLVKPLESSVIWAHMFLRMIDSTAKQINSIQIYLTRKYAIFNSTKMHN